MPDAPSLPALVEVRKNYQLVGYVSLADSTRCYAEYAKKYPGQTHARIIERGGWGACELDMWVPDWQLLDSAGQPTTFKGEVR